MTDGAGRDAPTPVQTDPEAAPGRKLGVELGLVAAGAGLAALLLYRFVIADPVLRYVLPALDAVAVALAVWLLVRPGRREHWDYAVAALVLAAVSLYFFVRYVTSSAPGGT